MDWKICAPFSVLIILLICSQCSCNWSTQVNEGKDEKGKIIWQNIQLKRQKREWVVPAVNIREGEDNRYRNPIAKVHSDMELKKGAIFYRVSGQGVDQPPYGIFVIDPKTGFLNVTSVIVDREVVSMLYLTVHAVTASGMEVEKPLSLRVRVMDLNDNPPIFSSSVFAGAVEENCKANTLVMQILASDADEENTVNSLIAYKILEQNPSDPPMFIMNQHTGQVFTMSNLLDREMTSSYSLLVSGTDLNGAAGGLSGQCGANIKILDVNDNIPRLEFDSYNVQFKENYVGLTDLRMRVFDMDEMYSDNWIAVFDIVSGNEGGWFAIDTDPQTNEGFLRIVKALDYEAMSSANLGIVVTNQAAFHYSIMSEYQAKVTNINAQVENVREGPIFVPSNYNIEIPSGMTTEELLNYVLLTVSAIDQDTGKAATNVVYKLDENSKKWLIIDENGNLRMTYEMARDTASGNPINDGKNVTATIFADDNSNPALTSTATVGIGMSTSSTQSCPTITQEKPTAITLTGAPNLASQNYSVQMIVKDKNGVSCPNPVNVVVEGCECSNGVTCDAVKQAGKSVSLGPAAIGLMVLGFLALLLALLLLPLCVCGSGAGAKFIPIAPVHDGAFHQWETEGAKPQDVDMTSPFITTGMPEYSEVNAGNVIQGVGTAAGSTVGAGMMGGTGIHSATTGIEGTTLLGEGAGWGGSNIANSYIGTMPPHYEGLNMDYVDNYFTKKADSYANEDESRPANDCLLIYDNEGIGSPVGSVGCCSFIADDLDDTYLDTLGPKFKTLAEICIGSEIEPMPSGEEPRLFPHVPMVETETNVIVDELPVSVPVNRSMPVSSSTYVTESTISSANLQPVRPMPETLIPGNVVVTETYTTSGGTLRPVTRNIDPGLPTNILVTERVVGSAAPAHGVFADLNNGSNVIVTKRVVQPVSGIELPNLSSLTDGSNVVLRERVVAPNSSRLSNSFNIPDINLGEAQNVLVTERVIQPISSIQGNLSIHPEMGNLSIRPEIGNLSIHPEMGNLSIRPEMGNLSIHPEMGSLSIRPEMGSSQNIYVTEKTVRSGPAIKTQMLSAEPLITQTVGSTSPSLTRSKVTKYSTVQYTKQ
ncbi:desmoglein-1-like [Leptodactylus fuscus]